MNPRGGVIGADQHNSGSLEIFPKDRVSSVTPPDDRKVESHERSPQCREGDLVWRMKGEARKVPTEGKFNASWEGPFKVRENLQNSTYRLEQLKPVI